MNLAFPRSSASAIRRRAAVFLAASTMLWTVGLPAISAAAEQEPDLAEELLEIMRESGDISEQRYQELKERAAGKKAESPAAEQPVAGEAAAAPDAPAVSAESPTWSARWSNGVRIERSDGAFDVRIGGRIQNDYAVIGYSNGLSDEFDGQGFGTEFRRARLYVKGTVYERLVFKAEYDFAEGDSDLTDVYMGLLFPEENLQVRVGHQKQPYSLQSMTSSNFQTFMERGLPDVFISRNRRATGIAAIWNPYDCTVFSTGAFLLADSYGDADLTGGFGQDDDRYSFATRLAGSPVYEDDGAKVVHIGGGYIFQVRGDDRPPDYSTEAESHLGADLLDTGDIFDVRYVNQVDGELAVVLGRFSFQSEVEGAFLQRRNGRADPDFWGAYAEASWFLTDDHRNYKRSEAIWDRVNPTHEFSPANGGWGAWQVAARYSYTDLDDGGVRGGEMGDVTLALNWYPYPNARVMLNYIHAHLNGEGDSDAGQIRFQVDF